ncbi:MAG: hypothetical protein LLG06_08745 [Desulfobacteraceae bacterium]|nr:hypothetical protein [Desulfobacteraceae bacterium]
MEDAGTEKTTRSAKWVIDLFRPSDAPGVARLFRSYYGEGYPIKAYTTPEKLIEENEAGRIISVVARTPDDDIVAHIAFYRIAPLGGLYEAGANLVRSEYWGACWPWT